MKINRFGIKNKLSTSQMQLEIFACTILVLLVEILYNLFRDNNITTVSNLNYVLQDVYIFIISISSCLLWDFLFYLPKLFGKNKISVKEYFYKIYSSYSYVSGAIIALLLPIDFKLYFIPVLTFASILIFKNLFGGIGKNIFNPAIVAILIANIFFKSNYYLGSINTSDYSSISVSFYSNTLFSLISFPSTYTSINLIYGTTLWNIFNGFYVGEIGTRNAFVLLFIFFYLLARKIIDYRLGLIFLGSYFIPSLLLFSCSNSSFYQALYNTAAFIFASPIIFIATFNINDPVTTANNRANKVVISLLFALLCFTSRIISNNNWGFYISILIINLISFILNKTTITLKNNTLQKIISIILLISIIITPIIYLGSKNLLLFQVK